MKTAADIGVVWAVTEYSEMIQNISIPGLAPVPL